MKTTDQVADILVHMTRDELFQIVFDAYKDQYNVRPRHMYNYTVAELASWYLSHYRWDEAEQMWLSIVPFDNNDYAEMV